MHSLDIFYLLQEQTQSSPFNMLFLIGGMILIMYFVLFRPQMKEQKKRRAMLSSVKKHDRVVTSGGIHGVVVSVSDSDIVLKIDENNNVRVKFTRAAVNAIISREGDEEAS